MRCSFAFILPRSARRISMAQIIGWRRISRRSPKMRLWVYGDWPQRRPQCGELFLITHLVALCTFRSQSDGHCELGTVVVAIRIIPRSTTNRWWYRRWILALRHLSGLQQLRWITKHGAECIFRVQQWYFWWSDRILYDGHYVRVLGDAQSAKGLSVGLRLIFLQSLYHRDWGPRHWISCRQSWWFRWFHEMDWILQVVLGLVQSARFMLTCLDS